MSRWDTCILYNFCKLERLEPLLIVLHCYQCRGTRVGLNLSILDSRLSDWGTGFHLDLTINFLGVSLSNRLPFPAKKNFSLTSDYLPKSIVCFG